MLLKTEEAFSGFAVPDLDEAKRFYTETLGLEIDEMAEGLMGLKVGKADSEVLVYAKPDHTPATFTVLNFPVDDIDAAVDDLVSKGVEFEHYGEPVPTDEKGVQRGKEQNRGPNIAWFRDPAGNILSIIED